VNEVQRAARLLAPAALLATALLLAGPPLAAAPPPVAPQTLELGKGPTIVIVHDLGGSRTSWMPTVRKLIGRHRVVLVELPGHGGSPLPDPFALEAAAEALDQVLAKQDPASTVLVGDGVGGALLLQALKAHPDRARGLVLLDAGLKLPLESVDAEQIKWFNRMLEERYDDFIKMLYRTAGRDSAEGLRIRAMVAQVPPSTMKAYYRALFTADATPAFKSLKVPVLFIGTDRLFKGPAGKEQDWPTVAKLLGFENPAAVPVRRIAGSSTLVMQDLPDSLAAVIADFGAQSVAAKK